MAFQEPCCHFVSTSDVHNITLGMLVNSWSSLGFIACASCVGQEFLSLEFRNATNICQKRLFWIMLMKGEGH